ncbi:hypothetical protein K474DRAFT_1615669 [Panus rudis PR-1116 ss-1]|nr:hypothetical protein K474DRAFT_1615669 [Panus rudis PR-1116 ss-1]
MDDTCGSYHDHATMLLTSMLCIGMVLSYLPQHWKIISSKSSEGFSPWFLLLGSTSSASGMLNIVVMQWGIIKCCPSVGAHSCIEMTLAIFQLFLQWFLFTMILVLYIIYYPPHLKYVEVEVDDEHDGSHRKVATSVKSDNWRLSITLSWVVFIHLILVTFVTFLLLLTNPSYPSQYPTPDDSRHRQLYLWATFLGVTSAVLAALQYAPQILHTYRMKLVGSLSIIMMCIQSPGAVLMVLSIALRPSTNWTTWIPYATAGALQAILLVMCIIWHFRQKRLGIDDFGRPLSETAASPATLVEGDSPVSVTRLPEDGVPVREAVGDAVHSDVREVSENEEDAHEQTPLLTKGREQGQKNWFSRLISRR